MSRFLFAGVMGLAYALGIFPGAVLAQGGYLNAQTNVEVDESVRGSADLDASVSNDEPDDSTSTTGNDDGASDQGSGDAQATSGGSFEMRRGDASADRTSNVEMRADSVVSDNDVEAFAAATLRTHERVEGVNVSENEVRVSFKEDARLLGVFPMSVTSRVVAMADGSVRIERPWYSFLLWGERKEIAADLEARVRAALEDGSLTTNGELSARAQARLMDEVARALSGVEVQADASAQADASLDSIIDASASASGTAGVLAPQ